MPLIRIASNADADAIVRVVNLAYRVEDFFIDGDRTSAAEIRALMTSGRFLILEEEGVVVGCAFVELRGEQGYFGMLSIDPARQGGGRGRRLVEAIEKACREAGCRHLELTVVDIRPELPPFYLHLGYKPTGETVPWPDDELDKLKQPAHFIVYSKTL